MILSIATGGTSSVCKNLGHVSPARSRPCCNVPSASTQRTCRHRPSRVTSQPQLLRPWCCGAALMTPPRSLGSLTPSSPRLSTIAAAPDPPVNTANRDQNVSESHPALSCSIVDKVISREVSWVGGFSGGDGASGSAKRCPAVRSEASPKKYQPAGHDESLPDFHLVNISHDRERKKRPHERRGQHRESERANREAGDAKHGSQKRPPSVEIHRPPANREEQHLVTHDADQERQQSGKAATAEGQEKKSDSEKRQGPDILEGGLGGFKAPTASNGFQGFALSGPAPQRIPPGEGI